MKNKIVLMFVPFLLVGCASKSGGSSNNSTPTPTPSVTVPQGFEQTGSVSETRRGSKISTSEANQIIEEIRESSNSFQSEYNDNPDKFIEDAQEFSYYFKNKIDDVSDMTSRVNYSRSAQFFSQHLTSSVVDEGEIYIMDFTHYEYVLNNQFVTAYTNNVSGKTDVDYHPIEEYTTDGIFTYLAEMILNIGNVTKDMLSQNDNYAGIAEQSSASGISIEYYSSGKGNLFIRMNMESFGIYLETLFEDCWLTYEYMYTDLTKLMSGSGYSMPYQRMMSELNINYGRAEIAYPVTK